MEFRDVGLLAAVIVGGLAIGWASGDGSAAPSPTEATPVTAQGSSSAPSQFGDATAPGAAAMPPLANRTTEGEQLDSAVQARAQAAFQPGTAAAGAAPANVPVMAPPPPAQSGSSWGGQSAASGSSWGGQGQSSGTGWGVQAGVAPASPAPAAPAQPATAPATEQQPTG